MLRLSRFAIRCRYVFGYSLDDSDKPVYLIWPERTRNNGLWLLEVARNQYHNLCQTTSICNLGLEHFYAAFGLGCSRDLRTSSARAFGISVNDISEDCSVLFFLDIAALVITTVAVMKICYNGHRLITRSNRLVSGQQKSKETQTNPPNNQPKPTKSDQSVKVRQVKHVCALTTWCIAQKPRLSQHLQQLIECHTSNT